MSEDPLQAIYLLADSQLLFWQPDGKLFIERLLSTINHDSPKAAYVGASNGDNPDYYSLFVAAMDGIGISHCRMIPTEPSSDDLMFISEADVILLAGGDVERGWNAFEQNGLKELIHRRYFDGATLIGVSAGAVQLGLFGWTEDDEPSPTKLFQTFRLVPFIVSAHDEKRDWVSLRNAVQLAGVNVRGIGIPHGGGAILRMDQSLEPIRFSLNEFIMRENGIDHNVLVGDNER